MDHDDMLPGAVRVFDGRKSLVLGVGVFAQPQGRWIHIHITGGGDMHTTVSNDPDSKRYHRTLFRDLRRVLVANDLWPYGDQGSETESAGG